ncbi:MAG: hypothetical protein SPJ84_03900 [Fusobacterium gastrosuis]|uniref:hypothetical protein n=1 Tax=Fusobacterium gastrosuis TaxID=1755100 RepID=UPI002A9BBF0E|nr:hypothetical protein [Fusobacteriaceae bacterium]MDY5794951.1 hypothetical protein [Fusobacterium gastrosuis]
MRKKTNKAITIFLPTMEELEKLIDLSILKGKEKILMNLFASPFRYVEIFKTLVDTKANYKVLGAYVLSTSEFNYIIKEDNLESLDKIRPILYEDDVTNIITLINNSNIKKEKNWEMIKKEIEKENKISAEQVSETISILQEINDMNKKDKMGALFKIFNKKKKVDELVKRFCPEIKIDKNTFVIKKMKGEK